jgi:hypothetical protein
MSLTRVRFDAFDADGCLFSLKKYTRLLGKIIDKYYDFLSSYKKKHTECDEDYLRIQVINMLNDAETMSFAEQEIQNPALKKRIKDVYGKLSPFIPGFQKKHAEIKILSEFIGCLDKLSPLIMKQIFYRANEDLILYLSRQSVIEEIKHLVVTMSTNRQSYIHDHAGMEQNATASIYLSMLDLTEYFNQQLKSYGITCSVSEFSMGDVYGHAKFNSKDEVEYSYFERGVSFRKVVEELTKRTGKKPVHLDHACYIYDKTKLTVVYALAHDAMIHVLKALQINPEQADVTINIFDNEIPILESLAKVLGQYPQLLPAGMTIRLFHYDGELTRTPVATITGKGSIDHFYQQNIRLMAIMCGHNLKDLNESFDAANQLNVADYLQRRSCVTKTDSMVSDSKSIYEGNLNLWHPVTKEPALPLDDLTVMTGSPGIVTEHGSQIGTSPSIINKS